MQLVCFPFCAEKEEYGAIDCLVLPKIDLFLLMQQTPGPGTGTFSTINGLLLALILLGTQPGGGLYKEGNSMRQKITLDGAVKKAVLKPYIQTEGERLQADLAASQKQLAEERAASQKQLAEERAASQKQLAEERAASQRKRAASQRKLLLLEEELAQARGRS